MLTPEAPNGQMALLLIIAVTLVLSAAIISACAMIRGTERLPAQVVRFLLTAGMLW
jgi:hypothetical protein